MQYMKFVFFVFILHICLLQSFAALNRKAIVERHNVILNDFYTSCAQVGNGEFAFSCDALGLQNFGGDILSNWAWHSTPPRRYVKPENFKFQDYDNDGRKVPYPTNPEGQEPEYRWLQHNPHRIHLARLRFTIDGGELAKDRVKIKEQKLDLWKGEVSSLWSIDDIPVEVLTISHPERDIVAVSIKSELLASGRLAVEIAFPDSSRGGIDWQSPNSHRTKHALESETVEFERKLDKDFYFVSLHLANAKVENVRKHFYIIKSSGSDSVKISCEFSPQKISIPLPTFDETASLSQKHWENFWNSGAAVDMSGSADKRWRELERRIVLSQYLLAVNAAGSLPPQDTGLYISAEETGKINLENYIWLGAHHALWGRWELLEKSLTWYLTALPQAQKYANMQGYNGARWPNNCGPDAVESPSPRGPFLIWQQPHPIFFAELDFRLHPTRQTLDKWSPVIDATADFMADFAMLEGRSNLYALIEPLISMSQRDANPNARNPIFELSYWRFGLRVANEWKSRMELPQNESWSKILGRFSPLPLDAQYYALSPDKINTYYRWTSSVPSQTGVYGILPGDGADPQIALNTILRVAKDWQFQVCSGWTFPMLAMSAARTGQQKLAVDFLLNNAPGNNFDKFGHIQAGISPYLPGNGALLYAVAAMITGWDKDPKCLFPESWKIKAEGFPHGIAP